MKNIVVFILLLIVIDAGYGGEPENFVKKTKINPSAVNLAVETALIFDAKDARKDMSLIDNIQNFLGKLKGYLRMRGEARFRTEDEKEGIFTSFLKDFSRIIVNYDNESLKNLTDVLALTMEPYYYKGTAFHKLIKSREFKTYIQDKIMDWADTDPKMLKYKMALAIATSSKESTPLTQFGSHLNKFFTENDSKKLKKLLRKFNNHERVNDTHKLVKRALEFIIFERYNKLNDADKLDLSYAIKNVSAFVMHNYPTPKFNHTTHSPHNGMDNHRSKVKESKTNEHNGTAKRKRKHKHSKKKDHNKTDKHNAKVKNLETEDQIETVELKDPKTRRFNETRRSRVARVKVNPLLPKQIVLNKNIEFNINTITEKNKYTAALIADDGFNSSEVQNEVPSTNDTNNDHLDEADTVILDTKGAGKKGKKKAERTGNNNETEVKPEVNNTLVDVYKQIMAIRIGSENITEIDREHNKVLENKNNTNADEKIVKKPKNRALHDTQERELFITKALDDNEVDTEAPEGNGRKMGVYFQSDANPTYYPVTIDSDPDTNTSEKGMIIENPHTTAAYNFDTHESSDEKDEKTTKNIDVIESDKEEYRNKVHEGANKIRDLLDTVIAQKLLEKNMY